MTSTILDLRGLLCPLPALRTRKALRQIATDDVLIVECTDPLSVIDIPHLVQERGDVLELQETNAGIHRFQIRRAG
jgi:tRNA 2-thiouridine synthesizing protein A